MIYAVIVFVLCLLMFIIPDKYTDKILRNEACAGVFCFLLFIPGCLIVVGIATNVHGIGEIARMEAFHNEICTTYEQTVERAEDITINAVERAEKQFGEILDTGNLAYFELAKSVNTNLQQLRDRITKYNNALYTYRRYNSNWFTDSFIPDVPKYLKPIKMK